MKKTLILLVLLMAAVLLFSCNDGTQTTSTSDSTNEAAGTSDASGTTAQETTTDTDTDIPGIDDDAVTEKDDDYTAVINEEEWVNDGTDYSSFSFMGSGAEVKSDIDKKYVGNAIQYYLVGEDGKSTEISAISVRQLAVVGARVEEDTAAKKVDVYVSEIEMKVLPEYKSLAARAGSYIMFDFTTNIPATFRVVVASTADGTSGAYTQGSITTTGSNGKYTGIAKCTIPYKKGSTFYINICIDSSSSNEVFASVPVTVTEAKYDSEYSLWFQGDWELIKDEDYLDNLIDLFYNVYPRLYARFGTGAEPKSITFMADKNYDGVAYCAGTLVCVSTAYANSNPSDIGFFAHEITHSVQQYGGKMEYTDGSWWTENMADHGRFRYFHWGYSTDYVKFYEPTDTSIQDWGWQPYGNCNWFFAYLDYKYPTTLNDSGDKVLGLIDSIDKLIKENNTGAAYEDDPYKEGTPFNNVVKEITGLATMEEVRLQYVKELKDGTWAFTGFGNYVDNFVTEGLDGVPDPEYPMLEPVTPGDKTGEILASPVTEGTNIAKGATIVEFSGEIGSEVAANIVDGDLTTMWRSSSAVQDGYKYKLMGIQHEIVIDLGASKSFDTYTIVNAGSKGASVQNPASWEILVSDDGKNWTSVDYQTGQKLDVASVNVGEQNARYVMLRYYKSTQSSSDIVRLYEFMLFDS